MVISVLVGMHVGMLGMFRVGSQTCSTFPSDDCAHLSGWPFWPCTYVLAMPLTTVQKLTEGTETAVHMLGTEDDKTGTEPVLEGHSHAEYAPSAG